MRGAVFHGLSLMVCRCVSKQGRIASYSASKGTPITDCRYAYELLVGHLMIRVRFAAKRAELPRTAPRGRWPGSIGTWKGGDQFGPARQPI